MKHFTALLILASALVSFACKETVTSSSGSGAPGDITGYVVVYDTNYQTMPDKSGVKVSLAGTPYSVLTDASGNWQLSNVPSGTYIVDVTKDHYSETKHFNFVYGGNGTYYWGYTATMYPIPNIFPVIVLRPFEDKMQITFNDTFIYVKNDSLRDSSLHFVRRYDTTVTKSEIAIFSSHTVPQYNKQGVACILFLGKNSSIDPAVPSSYLSVLTASPDTSGISNFTLLRSSLLNAGFASGDQIYGVIYATAVPSGTLLGYNDLVARKFIYTDLSPHPSEVKSFLLP